MVGKNWAYLCRPLKFASYLLTLGISAYICYGHTNSRLFHGDTMNPILLPFHETDDSVKDPLNRPMWQATCEKERRAPSCQELGILWNDNWLTHRLSHEAVGNVSGNTVFDVGGNIGRDTDHSSGAALVHVFEPMPENLEVLADKFSGNGRVRLHAYGLGSRKERYEVARTTNMNEGTGKYAQGDKVEIAVEDVAKIVRSHSTSTNIVLNINCEGCEYDILERILRDGTVARLNIAVHHTPNSLGLCKAMPLLLHYYRISYCDGPWMGFAFYRKI